MSRAFCLQKLLSFSTPVRTRQNKTKNPRPAQINFHQTGSESLHSSNLIHHWLYCHLPPRVKPTANRKKKTRDHSKLGHKNDSRSPHMDSPSPHWNPPVLTRTESWPRLSPLKGLSLSSKESLRDTISDQRSLKTECHTAVIKAIKTGNLHTSK